MTADLIGTVLTGVGVLLGVWRMQEGMRRDLTSQIAAVNTRIEGVRRDLTDQIAAVNTRIDNILLADRKSS